MFPFSISVQGQCVFASGSPFDPHTLPNGKTLVPGQGNNAYVFPGVALSIIVFGIRHISDSVFLEAAKVSLRMKSLNAKPDISQFQSF